GSARDEAKGWLALALVAVSLSAWWPAHQAFRVSRGLGSAGGPGGGLLLAAPMTYCWIFDLPPRWRWLRDVWLLWTPLFMFFLISDLWGHLLGNPIGLGEFLLGGATLSGLAVGSYVLREAYAVNR